MKIDWKNLNIKNESNHNPYDELETFIKKESYKDLKPIVKINNISQKFKSKTIYENISFEIFESEKVAFLGPNGSGKTLTISTIAGIYKPKEGNIEYLYEYETKPFEKISVQFQDLQFPSSLSTRDLVEFSIDIQDDCESNQEIIDGLKIFQLDKIYDRPMSKLSGGQQQRVNVFISMLGRPKVLILDEFTTGLDIAIKNNIQNYILNYCDKYNIALVIISHDIDCIESMVNRIILLADGKIFVDAKVEDIIEKFGSIKEFLKKYIVI